MKLSAKLLVELIVILVAISFSLFTLWLIDSWIKYPFLIFEFAVMYLIYYIINDVDIEFTIKRINMNNIQEKIRPELFLIIFSIILLLLNILNWSNQVINLVLAFSCGSLLCGYALLNIFHISKYFSKLEILFLSCITSYAFSAFLSLALLRLEESIRVSLVLVIFVIIGLVSLGRHEKNQTFIRSFARKIDALALVLISAFYFFSFYLLYPGLTLLGGDSTEHFFNSVILERTPELYTGWNYLLAHSHESMLIQLSSSGGILIDPLYEQSALLILSLLLPLGFYLMAKKYCEKIDSRIPSIATLIWVFLTNGLGGFAWIYFASLKLFSPSSTINMLELTGIKTQYGIQYSILGLWYVPVVISLAITLFLLAFIKSNLPQKFFVPIFLLLFVSLFFIYLLEAVIFVLFVSIYGVFSRNEDKINLTLLSVIFGLTIVFAIYLALPLILPRFVFTLSYQLPVIVPAVFSAISLGICYIRFRKGFFSKFSNFSVNLWKTLVIILIFVYMISLMSWFTLSGSFTTSQVDELGSVPWFMYPMVLGITGLLSLMTLLHICRDSTLRKSLSVFIVFLIFAFLAGELSTIINLFYFTPLRENRFIWFMKIPLGIFAAYALVLMARVFHQKLNPSLKKLAVILMIGIVITYGISTTFLSVERWNLVVSNPANLPDNQEIEAITFLRSLFNQDPHAMLITTSDSSNIRGYLAAPAGELGLYKTLSTADSADFANHLMSLSLNSHPYLYISSKDALSLRQNNGFSYLTNYLIPQLPICFENDEVKIYNMSKVSAPSLTSNLALVYPYDTSVGGNYHLANQLLSQGLYEYGVTYDIDDSSMAYKTLLLPFDPPVNNTIISNYENGFENNTGWSTIAGTWEVNNGTLEGGSNNSDLGIILSPIKAQNFNATFSLEPITFQNNTSNYAGLIYDYKDLTHYCSLEFLFSNNYIVCLLRVVNDVSWAYGYVIPSNAWSTNTGVETRLRNYNIRIEVNNGLNEVYIDNKKVFSEMNNSTVAGSSARSIGFMYGRLQSVQFDNATIQYSYQVNLREKTDYINYVVQGGTLVILNTNGYGTFANDFSLHNDNDTSINAYYLSDASARLDFPCGIKVSAADDVVNGSIICNYGSNNSKFSPFVIQKEIGAGKLIYVNIYPLASYIALGDSKARSFYPILGNFLQFLGSNLITNASSKIATEAFTREIAVAGDFTVNSSSILFSPEQNIQSLILYRGNATQSLTGMRILSINSSSFSVNESATFKDGLGLYAKLTLNSAFKIKFLDGNCTIKVDNGTSIDLHDINSIAIQCDNPIELILHSPVSIESNNTYFTELYLSGYSDLFNDARAAGQNVSIIGKNIFTITFSDSYTELSKIVVENAIIHRFPPITSFNVLSTLSTALFVSLVFLPFFVGIIIYFASKHSAEEEIIANNHLVS